MAKSEKKKLKVVSPGRYEVPEDAREDTSVLLPLEEYDYIIVSFSGGKDSIACYLHLLDLGVPPERIELWHQAIDGEPGVAERFFDWPITEAYCQAFADAFGSRLLYQWKEDGFKGEMLRENALTKPAMLEMLDGSFMQAPPGAGKRTTRMKFPQKSGDLGVRWCSSYLKIDVAAKVFTNDPRFQNAKTVMLTGERRGESGKRAKYAEVDRHKGTTKPGGRFNRRVDQWRPVLGWTEEAIWEIMERYRVRPHPAYYLGWSRVSCFPCIFGNKDQWASVRDIAPELFEKINNYEKEFGVTIDRKADIAALADKGTSYLSKDYKLNSTQLSLFDAPPPKPKRRNRHLDLALGEHYDVPLIVPPGEKWELPRGAYGHSGGPV